MKAMLVLVADFFGRTIQFPLTDEHQEITVGSLEGNSIQLPYKGVSRRHFSLIRNEADWLLKDLGSTNGTRLNGSLVKESIIKPDDVIHAGIVEFKVRELDKQRVVQLPVEKSRSVPSES